jgi:hypothetical protein
VSRTDGSGEPAPDFETGRHARRPSSAADDSMSRDVGETGGAVDGRDRRT